MTCHECGEDTDSHDPFCGQLAIKPSRRGFFAMLAGLFVRLRGIPAAERLAPLDFAFGAPLRMSASFRWVASPWAKLIVPATGELGITATLSASELAPLVLQATRGENEAEDRDLASPGGEVVGVDPVREVARGPVL